MKSVANTVASSVKSVLPSQYKKYATPKNIVIGGIVLAASAGLYFYTRQTAATTSPDIEQKIPEGGHSDKVLVKVEPEGRPVPSNAFMILKGQFMDKTNGTITVPEGYYYIFRDTGLGTGHQFIYGGTLGKNVSTFRIQIPTTFFQDGSYEVIVSDIPIPDSTLGAGEFANPVYQGGTTFKDSANVIKNHLLGYDAAPQFPSPNRVFPGDMPPQELSQDLTFI